MTVLKLVNLLFLLGVLQIEAYVLVQVRKDQNRSNVDALIHKVVPSEKFDEIAETARKQFKNFKQFTVKNKMNDQELDSIVFAIKTDQDGGRRQDGGKQDGGKQNGGKQDGGMQNGGDVIGNLVAKVISFLTPDKKDLPYYKYKLQKYNIKPEIVKFRNGKGKPSMMYSIDTESMLRSVRDALSSRRFKRYADKLVHEAAIIYRTFTQEYDKMYS